MSNRNITEPTRVRNFANFFKNYMSIWSIMVAALPIPITAFKLIPVFSIQQPILSTYTTLFCFLMLGLIFYSRHWAAKYLFPIHYANARRAQLMEEYASNSGRFAMIPMGEIEKVFNNERHYVEEFLRYTRKWAKLANMLPLILIILSIAAAFYYNILIEDYLLANVTPTLTRAEVLHRAVLPGAFSTALMIAYLGIFLFAESAFIMMAVKEYVQDLLAISDETQMLHQAQKAYLKMTKEQAAPPDILNSN